MNAAEDFIGWGSRQPGQFDGPGVTVLMYHRIGRPPPLARRRALYVAERWFHRQIGELRAAGLTPVALDNDFPGGDGDPNAFAVTFDDGFRSTLQAIPGLRAAGVRATVFLVAGLLGKTNRWDAGETAEARLMDEPEVRAWLDGGQNIGSHTLTHPALTTLPPDRARAEIADSKKLLEDRFGRPVTHFCYPYGDVDPRVRDLVAEAGYRTACTTRPGRAHPGEDPLMIPRVLARGKGLPPWTAALRRTFSRVAASGRRPATDEDNDHHGRA